MEAFLTNTRHQLSVQTLENQKGTTTVSQSTDENVKLVLRL